MSELIEKKPRDYSVFDKMNTEALEEILKADAQQLDDNSNLDAILYITELLNQRAKADEAYTFDVDANKPDFDALLICTQINNIVNTSSNSNIPPASDPNKKTNMKHYQLGRIVLIAAILMSLLFVLSGVASATFGINIWGMLASWTDDLFSFGGNINNQINSSVSENQIDIDSNTDMVFSSLQEALDYYKITELSAPTHIPDGYELCDVIVNHSSAGYLFYCDFISSNNSVISVAYQEFLSVPNSVYEKNTEDVDQFSLGDTTFYSFSNTNTNTIAWITGDYECSIMGNVPINVLKEIVYSIFEKG